MPIRTGIIGTGFGAAVHAPVLAKHPAFELVSIASMRRGRAEAVAAQMEIPHAYDDWQEMLQHSQLDVVVIATKPGLHLPMTKAALATSHVLCEKPLAITSQQAEAMQSDASKTHRIASINFEWRYLPERKEVKNLLEHHAIGHILHVNWSEAWPMWPQITQGKPSWDWQLDEGGGLLGAIGSHIIDALCWWFGPFATIQGRATNHVPKRRLGSTWVKTTAEDSFSFIGEFETGVTCSVNCTVAAVGIPTQVEIFGTEGSLRISGHDLFLATTDDPVFRIVDLMSTSAHRPQTPAQRTRRTMDTTDTMADQAGNQLAAQEPEQKQELAGREFAGNPQTGGPGDDAAFLERSFPEEIRGYVLAQWSLYDDLACAIESGQFKTSRQSDDGFQLPSFEDGVKVQATMDAIRKTFSQVRQEEWS